MRQVRSLRDVGGPLVICNSRGTKFRRNQRIKRPSKGFDNFKMGAGGSKESSQHKEFWMNIEHCPENILLLVLSFVPDRDLILRCRLVSQHWKRLVDSPSPWRIKCEREHRREILLSAEMCPDIWQRACLKEPFSRNLLCNPCGKENLNHWSVLNGGDGWTVENNHSVLEGAEIQTCFVSSFQWCMKSQIIDLVQEGLSEHFLDIHQPVICISDWYSGGNDCGCVYEIKVQLLASNMESVIKEFSMAPNSIPQWTDSCYQQVYYEFRNYGPRVRYVNFTHKGKGTQFWKGWYGARISNSSVTVKCEKLDA